MSQADSQPGGLTFGEWAEPSPTPTSRPKPLAVIPDRRLSTSCRAGLDSETRDLLQARLRAASLMLAIAFGVLGLRESFFPRPFRGNLYLLGLMALLLIGNCALLSGRWKPPMRQLRMLELATFLGILAAFIAGQTLGLNVRFARGLLPPDELRIQFKSSIIGTLLLILTYGIFIPNRWRRALWIIVLMALTPLVAPVLLGVTNPAFRQVAEEAWTAARLTENSLFLALGAAIAVFGTYTLGCSRHDEFRARWLNQYRLTQKLGQGGMGEVYLAEHDMLRRPCAIKLIRPSLSAKPRVLARFEREAQATARLSHWNTIEVFDYGCTEDGTFYYVMEYLPGLSLQALVDRHGPLPPGRVIYLLRQACGALFEAHQAGFIHRDLKPPNIFAAYRGACYDVAKVLDFGLVKSTKEDDSPSLTREGMVTGSPLYMAPEQVMRTHPPDPRTDIYAVGAIAYFLLTGRPPFLGDDSMSVMVAHARDPVVPPSELRAEVPADLEAVILRCLEKKPNSRYQDAEALAEALGACRDAGAWSAEQARSWWLAHEPELVAELTAGELTEPDVPPADLAEGEPDGPTLAGSEVEVVEPPEDDRSELSVSLDQEPGALGPRA